MDRHGRFALLARQAVDDREHGLPGRARFQGGPVGIRTVRMPGRWHDPAPASHADQRVLALLWLLPHLCRRQGQARGHSRRRKWRLTFMEAHRAGVARRASSSPRAFPGGRSEPWTACWRRWTFSGSATGSPDTCTSSCSPGADSDQVPRGCPAGELASRSTSRGRPARVVGGASPERRTSTPETCLPKTYPGGATVARLAARGPTRDRAAPAGTTTQFVVGSQGEYGPASSWAW